MRLGEHRDALAALRFCPMFVPAGEVSAVTGLSSHATHFRMMQLWRIASGHLAWSRRDAELIFETTLDSISEAFDPYRAPIWRLMADARADAWEAGFAPTPVCEAVARIARLDGPPVGGHGGTVLLCGEIVQTGDAVMAEIALAALRRAGIEARPWLAATGASAYWLGARELARRQIEEVVRAIGASRAERVIVDGPETLWSLAKLAAEFACMPPVGVVVESLSSVLARSGSVGPPAAGAVFVHDSRAAYLLCERPPDAAAIMPGYESQPGAYEGQCGDGEIYRAPRALVDRLGRARVWGAWSRALAKSCGSDDGLWLTYPRIASGLAIQRHAYARALEADLIATDSPLAAHVLRTLGTADADILWLPEAFALGDAG